MGASRCLGSSLVCWFGVVAACLAGSEACSALSYTATYFASRSDGYRLEDGVLTNPTTGAAIPFARPATSRFTLSDQQAAQMPTVTALQGNSTQIPVTFGMKPVAANSSGTILGELPVVFSNPYGDSRPFYGRRSSPWEYTTYGYSVPQSVGGSSFHQLLSSYDEYASAPILSEANTILVTSRNSGSHLVDVATGVDTPVKDLIPEDLLARLPYVGVGEFSSDGRLLVFLSGSSSDDRDPSEGYYLLSPAQEAGVPEPSTLAIAAAIAAGAAVRAWRRRSG